MKPMTVTTVMKVMTNDIDHHNDNNNSFTSNDWFQVTTHWNVVKQELNMTVQKQSLD